MQSTVPRHCDTGQQCLNNISTTRPIILSLKLTFYLAEDERERHKACENPIDGCCEDRVQNASHYNVRTLIRIHRKDFLYKTALSQKLKDG